MTVQLKHLPAGQGPQFNVIGGDQITIKAASEDTEGAFTLIETVTPAGAGPPPHVHRREDEIFYVLEGCFEFHVGKETIRAAPGSVVMAPRNIPHRFQNTGDEPGKLLIVCQPAGFEKFVEEFAALPADQPPDFGKMAEIGQRHGIEFVQSTDA